MNYERNNFLTEEIFNCKHEYEAYPRPYGYGDFDTELICNKCNKKEGYTINFSSWEAFGKLWEWCNTQEWWKEYSSMNVHDRKSYGIIPIRLISPDNFANAVYEYLKEK